MRKKRKKIWILLGTAVVLFLLFAVADSLVSAPIIRVFGDSMDWRSRWLMGRHGVDCGTVRVNGDPKTATECALKAQSEGKPFRVRYDIMGYDSAVAGGIVRTSSGELYALSFVGNPSGSGGTSLWGQRSSKAPCLGEPKGPNQLLSTAACLSPESDVAEYRALLVFWFLRGRLVRGGETPLQHA